MAHISIKMVAIKMNAGFKHKSFTFLFTQNSGTNRTTKPDVTRTGNEQIKTH